MLWRVLMAAKYFSNHTDPSTPDQLRQWAAVFVTGISLFVLSKRHKVSLPTRACRRALPCACCAPRPLQLHPRAAAKLASNQCPTSATGLPYCNLLCNTSRKAFAPDQVHFSTMSSVLALTKLTVSDRRTKRNATSTRHINKVGAAA